MPSAVTHPSAPRCRESAPTPSYAPGTDAAPLSRTGRFGDTFDGKFPIEDGGGERTFAYALRGRVRGSRLTGSLSVTATDRNPDGAVSSTCKKVAAAQSTVSVTDDGRSGSWKTSWSAATSVVALTGSSPVPGLRA